MTNSMPGWLVLLLALPAGLALGFGTGDSLKIVAAATAGVAALIVFFLVPLSAATKISFLLVAVTFLQRAIGYFRVGEVRGVNVGNLLIVAMGLYWLVNGLARGRLYKPGGLDFAMAVTVIALPLLSIYYATYFRRVPGYDFSTEIIWYKQWVTPFVYFFFLSQTLEDKREVRRLFYLVLGLVGLAVIDGLPEALRFSSWHDSRSEGLVGQANDYAAFLSTMAPFPMLIFFLLSDRPIVRVIAIGLVASMAVCLLTTYSRAGYIGFGLAGVGALYFSFKSTRRLAMATPALIVAGVCLVPLIAAPQLLDGVLSRFETKSYKRAQRKSYDKYDEINQYSGGRIQLWNGAIAMAEENPIFGVGFHAFEPLSTRYTTLKWGNYPHNQFLGAAAEGGILFLCSLLYLYWKILRYLVDNWRKVLAQADRVGQVICGGALLSFAVMISNSLANDFLNPGAKTTIFWVVMAGALKYGGLAHSEEGRDLGSTAARNGVAP